MKKWIFLAGTLFGGLYIIKKVARKMETGVLIWNPKNKEPEKKEQEEQEEA